MSTSTQVLTGTITVAPTMTAVDVNDGREVAMYLSGYHNCYGTGNHKEFFAVLDEQPKQRYNYMVLLLYWLGELRSADCDLRNEATVEFARDIWRRYEHTLLGDIHTMITNAPKATGKLLVERRTSPADAARLLCAYLSKNNAPPSSKFSKHMYEDFVEYMLFYEHRTVQQNTARFLLRLCKHLDEKDTKNIQNKSVKLARAILQCQRPLPFI